MTVLNGSMIRNRLECEDIEQRLVVSPLLCHKEQLRKDQASVDVRLGCNFALVYPSAYGVIDEFDNAQGSIGIGGLTKLYNTIYVPMGGSLVIHPHQFILAQTLEYIRLPQDLMAYVVGRSTWGRVGLIVATAIGVHPHYAGCLTLELRNLGETPLTLYPGQAIAQLFLHSVHSEQLPSEAGVGQYSGAVDILPRKMSSKRTHAKLEGLRNKKHPQ